MALLLLSPLLWWTFLSSYWDPLHVCVCVCYARAARCWTRSPFNRKRYSSFLSTGYTAPYLNRQKCRSHPLRGETSFLVRMMDVEASETILLSNLYHVELLDSWGSFELFSLVHIFLSLSYYILFLFQSFSSSSCSSPVTHSPFFLFRNKRKSHLSFFLLFFLSVYSSITTGLWVVGGSQKADGEYGVLVGWFVGRVLRDGHQSVARERLVVGAYDRQETPFILFFNAKKGSFYFFSLSVSSKRTCGGGGDERKRRNKSNRKEFEEETHTGEEEGKRRRRKIWALDSACNYTTGVGGRVSRRDPERLEARW